MRRMRLLFLMGVSGLVSGLLAACGGGGGGGAPATRTDSAGVEIVTSGPKDVLLDWRLEPRFTLGGADEGPQAFYSLWHAAVGADSAGRVYVLDSEAARVVVFGPDGSYLRAMGQQGGGPGEMKNGYRLDVMPDGTVSVFDWGKMSLVRWDAAGVVLPELRMPPPVTSGTRMMAMFVEGYYITVPGTDAAGDRLDRLVRVVKEDTTLVAEAVQPDNGAHMFESCHVGINMPPLFTATVRWDYRADALAVAVGAAYAVDVYRDQTRVRSIRRAIPPVQATDALAMAEVGKGMTISFPGRGRCTVPPEEVAAARGHADVVPNIRDLALTPDGSLWVRRWVSGADTPPIDVFDATGAYVGTLPDGTPFPVLFLPDGGVGIVSTDKNDVQRLVIESVVKGERAG